MAAVIISKQLDREPEGLTAEARRHGVIVAPGGSLQELELRDTGGVRLNPFNKGYNFDFGRRVRLQDANSAEVLEATNGSAVASYCDEVLESESRRVDGMLRERLSPVRTQKLLDSMQSIERAEDLLSAVANNMSNMASHAEIFRAELPRFRRLNYRAAVGIFNDTIDSEIADRALKIVAQALLRGSHKEGKAAMSPVAEAVAAWRREWSNLFLPDAEKERIAQKLTVALLDRRAELAHAGRVPTSEIFEMIVDAVSE